MKKMMMVLALVLTVASGFAGETINNYPMSSFKDEFSGATDVTWTVARNYYKAAFTLNGQKLFAFYNAQGDFIGITRFISSVQLPKKLQNNLRKSYGIYWITDLFEMATTEDTGYYVTLESANQKLILKSIDGSNWSVYQREEKQ